LDAYGEFLSGVVATPGASIDSVPLVSPTEADALRARSRGKALPIGEVTSVVPAILARAQDRGEAVILSDGTQAFTGEALHDAVHRVAAALQLRGVGRGDGVLVALPRGAEQIVALLGVMVAGAAYVPIDPDYPDQRRRQVIEDLTARRGRAPLMLVGADADAVAGAEALTFAAALAEPPLSTLPPIAGDDLAYVIYTSGSTGRAKGVAVRHRNLLASTLARGEHYAQAPTRYLLVSSCAFDSSVAGIFWTLMDGDTLVVAPAQEAADPRALAQLIEGHGITHTLMLPGLYALLLEAAAPAQLVSLRTVIVAGEACPVGVAQRHGQVLGQQGVQLTNEYGPTEGTVWASAYDCTGTEVDHVPIGRPIAGAETYVLDGQGGLLPDGAVGELWIGGAGVAEGYLGREDLTDARFSAPAAVGAGRCYRTGDLVRRGSSGELEYLGRADEQIKLRGFRIEPAEIESLLREHPQVRDAAVGVVEEGAGGRLVAWCVAQGEAPTTVALREHLSARVPAYMVPTHVQMLETLPRLPNGKVNRQRLPAVVATAATATAPIAYADDTERDLA
ncbi:MAG: amino acid adenylation domain-containing protein, partial [Pseudomonadota bacterium]